MDSLPPPLALVVLLFAGWVNRQQQSVIDYLLEENRVLRAALGPRRLRLTDDRRRRLAVKGQVLGRRQLAAVVGIVTPGDTRHHPAVVSAAGRHEVRRKETATRSPDHAVGYRRDRR